MRESALLTSILDGTTDRTEPLVVRWVPGMAEGIVHKGPPVPTSEQASPLSVNSAVSSL
jgi:hypothetical protein